MSSSLDPTLLPPELRELGEFRKLFESSSRSVMATVRNGLFPIPFGIGLIGAAYYWFKPPHWAWCLLFALGGTMILNGIRVIIQALRRRRQKIATFEMGFAIWRNDVLKVYKWDQVEEVDTTPQFFGFTIICRTDDGRRDKIHFDVSTDPTMNPQELWREAEEMSARAKIPAVLKTIAADEEAEFVRRIWGKIVGTRIGLSRMGITEKPRYGSTQFLDWSEVGDVILDGGALRITEKSDSSTWAGVTLLDVPGYVALVAAAEQTRQAYLNEWEQVSGSVARAIEIIDTEQEVKIGNIGISIRGLRVGDVSHSWVSIFGLWRQFDHIEVDADPEQFRLEYAPLSVGDRMVLYQAAMHARIKADPEKADNELEDEVEDNLET